MPAAGISWTHEQIDQIRAMRNASVSLRTIAHTFNCSVEAIERLCRKNKIATVLKTKNDKMNEAKRKAAKITLPPLPSLQLKE